MKPVVTPGRESNAERAASSRSQDRSEFGRNSGGLHRKDEGGREWKERKGVRKIVEIPEGIYRS